MVRTLLVPWVAVMLALPTAAAASSDGLDALDALRARLAASEATTPVEGRYRYVSESLDLDEPENPPLRAQVDLGFAIGERGLRFDWSPRVLAQAAEEAAQADPDAPRPVSRAMDFVSVGDVQDLLDGSATLERTLRNATLVETAKDAIDGQPTTRLNLALAPPQPARIRKYLRDIDATGTLWLDEAGWPVRFEQDIRVIGRIFLVIGFELTQYDDYRFRRFGDRLVAVRHDARRSGAGGGERQASDDRVVLEVRCTLDPCESGATVALAR